MYFRILLPSYINLLILLLYKQLFCIFLFIWGLLEQTFSKVNRKRVDILLGPSASLLACIVLCPLLCRCANVQEWTAPALAQGHYCSLRLFCLFYHQFLWVIHQHQIYPNFFLHKKKYSVSIHAFLIYFSFILLLLWSKYICSLMSVAFPLKPTSIQLSPIPFHSAAPLKVQAFTLARMNLEDFDLSNQKEWFIISWDGKAVEGVAFEGKVRISAYLIVEKISSQEQ